MEDQRRQQQWQQQFDQGLQRYQQQGRESERTSENLRRAIRETYRPPYQCQRDSAPTRRPSMGGVPSDHRAAAGQGPSGMDAMTLNTLAEVGAVGRGGGGLRLGGVGSVERGAPMTLRRGLAWLLLSGLWCLVIAMEILGASLKDLLLLLGAMALLYGFASSIGWIVGIFVRFGLVPWVLGGWALAVEGHRVGVSRGLSELGTTPLPRCACTVQKWNRNAVGSPTGGLPTYQGVVMRNR